MAKSGSRGSARGRDAGSRRAGGGPGSSGKGKQKAAPGRKPRQAPRASAPKADEPVMPATFTLGAIPGATPGKWIDTFHERMPQTALELIPLAVSDQRRALIDGEVEAALVRLPLSKDGLHVIALYDEIPVVVCSRDSHLTAAEELESADLIGEVLIVPADDLVGIQVPGTVTPRFDPPVDTAEAIATVAAGVGVVVVPMSLARLHQRKDVEYRPLRDAPTSRVALAWPVENTSPAVEAFIGIVRGRTANSSRG